MTNGNASLIGFPALAAHPENLATIVIAAGVLMLLQPFSMALYTYSFATTLAGTVLFIAATKFPE
jgi:hypothetical protein